MSFATFDPAELSAGRIYDIVTGLVVPRPIAFVSTISAQGRPNIAPFSYFMPGGLNPPSLAFCPVLDPRGERKDTLQNVRDTGEFVVNLVHGEMAIGMNRAAYRYEPDEDEWGIAGFTALESTRIRPARVAESRAQFECELHTVIEHGSGPSASAYVVGEIVAIHIDERLDLAGGDEAFQPLARLGSQGYWDFATAAYLKLERPNRP